jgi:hypothetical protein
MVHEKPFRVPVLFRLLCCVGVIGSTVSGCSSQAVISGKVTYKNTPLSGGEVSFIAADGKSRSSLINSSGDYEVVDAPLGATTIVIVSTRVQGETGKGSPLVGSSGPAAPVMVKSVIPQKYNDPSTSGLSYVVQRGRQTKNIDLRD